MDSDISKNVDPFLNEGGSIERHFERDSWKEMGQKLYSDISILLNREGELIRAEVNEKAVEAKNGAVSLIGGGVALFVGLICVAATSIILLDLVTEIWLAASIVTVVFLLVGAIMLYAAKEKLASKRLKPNRSIEAFGEIRHSLKEKVNEIIKH
jgi:hypothetical protein